MYSTKVTLVLSASLAVCLVNSAYAIHGDATYYNPSVGLTACGTFHNDDELIAATAFAWWTTPNPNVDPMCQKIARVTDPQNGNSVVVRIRDKCQGCQWGDIDLSEGAFRRLRDLSVGRFKVNWDFI